MATKPPPDSDLELNQILNLKEDLDHHVGHHSLANGETVDMMLNDGSMRESLSYRTGISDSRRSVDKSRLRRWVDSFYRDPKGRMTPKNAFVGGPGRNYFDLRVANYRTAHPLLAKELKGRHLQMIAIGGSIGECAQRVTFFVHVSSMWDDCPRSFFVQCVPLLDLVAGASATAVHRCTLGVSPM